MNRDTVRTMMMTFNEQERYSRKLKKRSRVKAHWASKRTNTAALYTQKGHLSGGSDGDRLCVTFRMEEFAVQGKPAGEVKIDFLQVAADVSVDRGCILVRSATEEGREHTQEMAGMST